eukprot:TRINITY_DN5354_c0_g1_i3.p1 TRINITY_DN5354_c0_g1~~TRINITY_DN5354_c0_g1_i3.p1  ORF type:complete len:108 (-),score=12.48 TRINITY_DN5354_c0_g1_i3:12-335(-)
MEGDPAGQGAVVTRSIQLLRASTSVTVPLLSTGPAPDVGVATISENAGPLVSSSSASISQSSSSGSSALMSVTGGLGGGSPSVGGTPSLQEMSSSTVTNTFHTDHQN